MPRPRDSDPARSAICIRLNEDQLSKTTLRIRRLLDGGRVTDARLCIADSTGSCSPEGQHEQEKQKYMQATTRGSVSSRDVSPSQAGFDDVRAGLSCGFDFHMALRPLLCRKEVAFSCFCEILWSAYCATWSRDKEPGISPAPLDIGNADDISTFVGKNRRGSATQATWKTHVFTANLTYICEHIMEGQLVSLEPRTMLYTCLGRYSSV